MNKELSALHKIVTWDLVLDLLVRVLLVIVGCIKLRLIVMDLFSNSKLGWLQKDIYMVWIMSRLLLLLRK